MNFFNQQIKKQVIDPIAKKDKLWRANRLLSSWYMIFLIILFLDTAIFFLINGLYQATTQLAEWLPELKNAIVTGNTIPNYPSISLSYLLTVSAPRFFYIILFIVLILIDLRIIYMLRVNHKDLNVGQKGSQRWTTENEIKQQYKRIPDSPEKFSGEGGFPVRQHNGHYYIDDSTVNNLIMGMTRSGKGEMYVFPMIDIYSRAESQASLIITDPKLELYSAAKETLEKRGYEVHVLNLIDPLNSMGVNSLHLIMEAYREGNISEAELLCSSLGFSIFNPEQTGSYDKFFNENAVHLLSAFILAHADDCTKEDAKLNTENRILFFKKKTAYQSLDEEKKEKIKDQYNDILSKAEKAMNKAEKYKLLSEWKDLEAVPDTESYPPVYPHACQVTMYSVIRTFQSLSNLHFENNSAADLSGIEIYFNSRPDGDPAKQKFISACSAGSRTKGSIYSTMLTKLLIFTYTSIAKMTAENSVDLKEIGFGEKPIAVFLGMPDYDTSNHFIASIFIRQLYFVLAKCATKSKSGKCDRRVVFILDEFGNLPAIESMANIITVCLGRNILFNLVIQSLAQLEKLYGKDADTIIGNCGNQVFIQGSDNSSAESFSKSLGNETVTEISRTGHKFFGNKMFTENYIERPLMFPNELMSLVPGESVIFRRMKRNALDGSKVQPTPILNTGNMAYTFRYQNPYLSKVFPNKSYHEMPTEQRIRSINLQYYCWPVDQYIGDKIKAYKKNNTKLMNRIQMLLDEDEYPFTFSEQDRYKLPLETLGDSEQIEKILTEVTSVLPKDTDIPYELSPGMSIYDLFSVCSYLKVSEMDQERLLKEINSLSLTDESEINFSILNEGGKEDDV